MVRRFIEHEEIGLLHKQTSQMGPHDPTAGKHVGWTKEILLGVSEAGENLLGLGLQLIAVELFETILRLAEIFGVLFRDPHRF